MFQSMYIFLLFHSIISLDIYWTWCCLYSVLKTILKVTKEVTSQIYSPEAQSEVTQGHIKMQFNGMSEFSYDGNVIPLGFASTDKTVNEDNSNQQTIYVRF